MGTSSYESCYQQCVNLLTTYSEIIKASNKQGLGNNSKASEEVYRGLLNILYPQSYFQSPDKVNEPAIDLFDHSQKTVVQIKSSLTRTEIRECVEKFSRTPWYEARGYDLIILLTTSFCLPKVEKFQVGSCTYYNYDHCYLDNSRLLKRIDGSNCNQVLEYLRLMTTDSPQDCDYQPTQTVNNYGTTLNFSNSGDVNLDGATFGYSPDNRQLTIDDTSSAASLKNLLSTKSIEPIPYDQDCPDNQLQRISSSILKVDDLYVLVEPEIKKIYNYLEVLDNTHHEDIAKILWLVVYFENSSKKVPPMRLQRKMQSIKQSINLKISPEYRDILSDISCHSKNAKTLIKSVKYGEPYA